MTASKMSRPDWPSGVTLARGRVRKFRLADGTYFTLRRPKNPAPALFKRWDSYLLHVWPDGFEQAVKREQLQTRPLSGFLSIDVTRVGRGQVIEQTTTRPGDRFVEGRRVFVVPVPPGRGWTYVVDGFGEDASGADYAFTLWQRMRTHEVFKWAA